MPGGTSPTRSKPSGSDSSAREGVVHDRAFVAGIRGTMTGNPGTLAVVIDSVSQLGTVSSSARVKEAIQDMGPASDDLLRLRPVTFRYRQPFGDGTKPTQYGLIADEVAAVYPELPALDRDGRPTAVQYHVLPALLLNELQDQQRKLDVQQRALEDHRRRLDAVDFTPAFLR